MTLLSMAGKLFSHSLTGPEPALVDSEEANIKRRRHFAIKNVMHEVKTPRRRAFKPQNLITRLI